IESDGGQVSLVLRKELEFITRNPAYDYAIPVVVRVPQNLYSTIAPQVGRVLLPSIKGYAARLTGRQIQQILNSRLAEYVTLDAKIRVTSSPADSLRAFDENPYLASIGADQAQSKGYTGRGITVAVFDSGISFHPDLAPRRVVEAIDFTSGEAQRIRPGSDDYGHGTHVAGIIGGTGRASSGLFRGVAPNVNFVDLRVVGADGSGQTSNLIQAVEWVIQNKERLNVRVANFSVSHPPFESYKDSPLAQSVGKLVESGVIAVASSGNL